MRVLVAGGSGFIGKNFLLKSNSDWKCFATYHSSLEFPAFLLAHGLKHVEPVYVDMTSLADVSQMAHKIGSSFDVCLYAMGNSDIAKSCRDPSIDNMANVGALLNLLRTVTVKKFIFISSGAVYEGHGGAINPSLPVNPTIPYSVSKLASERYIAYFQKKGGHIDNYLCLRFFGAYGPMEPSRKIYTNLIKSFCVDERNEYTINGDGKNYIDAMYIEDAVEGIMRMVNSDKGNKILDYCFGSPLTINELVRASAHALGKNILLLNEGAAAEYTTFYASPLEVEALFGFRPRISLSDGLREFKKYLVEE